MKKLAKTIIATGVYLFSSSALFADNSPHIDLYYEDPVILKNTKSKLKWSFQNVDYCESSNGSKIYSGGSWETTRTRLGVGSSYITCYKNGEAIKKNAHYYVIHDGPSGATTTFKDAGGGRYYDDKVSSNYTYGCLSARSLQQINQCMDANAKLIFIPKDVTIEVNQSTGPLVIKEGVTIASDRGLNGSSGATIKYLGSSFFPAVRMKSNSRLTGFRVVGPIRQSDNQMYRGNASGIGVAIGYIFNYDDINGEFNPQSEYLNVSNVTVDNNEIYNWPYTAVRIGYSSRIINVTHNYIHNNKHEGTGYGVLANGTEPENYNYSSTFIYKNIFSLNRHDIASSGYAGNSYRALYNIVFDGPIAAVKSGSNRYLHHFDVHGCYARSSDTCEFVGGNAQAKTTIDGYFPNNNGDFSTIENGNDAGMFYYVVNNIFSLSNPNHQRAVQFNGKPSATYGPRDFISTVGYNWMTHSQIMATNTSGNGQARGAVEVRNYDNGTLIVESDINHVRTHRNVDVKSNDLN